MAWVTLTTSTGDTVFVSTDKILHIVSSKAGSAVFLTGAEPGAHAREIQVREDAPRVTRALQAAKEHVGHP